MHAMDRSRIVFVCLGNICRSPTAEGVMRHVVAEAGLEDQFMIDSAGTGAWHAGSAADARSQAEAERRGLHLDSIARRFLPEEHGEWDLVIAMDRENLTDLRATAPDEETAAKVRLLRDFDPTAPEGAEVPDPYYGGEDGFRDVFDMVERACRGLLAELG